MNTTITASRPRKSGSRSSTGSLLHPFSTPRSPHTPSLPDARPRSDRFRCGGRKSKFLAVWRVLSQHHFGYDALGRLSTWQKSWRDWATAMQTGTWALTHDTDDQLTGIAETDAAATPTGSFAYGYDLAGNRTTADRTTPAGGTVNRQWTPNGLNQLTAQSAGPEAGAYTHDLDGNLLADNTRTYQWDAENRLVGVTGPFGTVTWEYDAFSRRVKQHDTAPAGPEIVRDLIWEGLSIIESRNQATGEIRRYYGNGEERQLAATVTRLHYTTDHLGSIRELTDATGTIRARYDYDPYGNVTKLSGDIDTDFAYTGHYYHAASGLHLAPYRGYNPKLGRWLSRDPIEEGGGINLYGYVGNRVLGYSDPFGFQGFSFDGTTWTAMKSGEGSSGPTGLVHHCPGYDGNPGPHFTGADGRKYWPKIKRIQLPGGQPTTVNPRFAKGFIDQGRRVNPAIFKRLGLLGLLLGMIDFSSDAKAKEAEDVACDLGRIATGQYESLDEISLEVAIKMGSMLNMTNTPTVSGLQELLKILGGMSN